MFIHTKKPLITSFYIKNTYFCRISDESALFRNFLRNERVKVKKEVLIIILKLANALQLSFLTVKIKIGSLVKISKENGLIIMLIPVMVPGHIKILTNIFSK